MTLRLVLAVSLDGRLAAPAGGAAQLAGAADRRALEECLAWADACLMGAGSLRAHGSSCLIHAPDLLSQRAERGAPAQPPLLLVSRQCPPPRLDPDWPFWRQPLQRWLVAPASQDQLPPAGFERLLPLQPWPQLLAELAHSQGLERLLLLGGAQLAGELLQADLVDELQLSLCPLLLGGTYPWLPLVVVPKPQRWQLLEQRPLDRGELLLRYQRTGNC